jgi:hypothetical protein
MVVIGTGLPAVETTRERILSHLNPSHYLGYWKVFVIGSALIALYLYVRGLGANELYF